jgi:hypothetical protein
VIDDDEVDRRLAELEKESHSAAYSEALNRLREYRKDRTHSNFERAFWAARDLQARGENPLALVEILTLLQPYQAGAAPGRIPDERRHRNVGVSMSPAAASLLRRLALDRGVSQGRLIEELLNDADSTSSTPKVTADATFWTVEQRQLALELTRAAASSPIWGDTERTKSLGVDIVHLYEDALREIASRRIFE